MRIKTAIISRYFPKDADIIAMDCDSTPNDWPGLAVLGRGGNVAEIEQQMRRDVLELANRTELRSVGEPVGAEIVRVVEEYPFISAELSEGLKKGATNPAKDWLAKLLRRGRKAKMAICLVSQEFEVAALGIKGEGGLRRAFTIVYLGAEAEKQLDQVRDTEERKELRAWLRKQKRPALVESGGLWYACAIPEVKDVGSRKGRPVAAAVVADQVEDSSMVFEYLADEDDQDDSPSITMAARSDQGGYVTIQLDDGRAVAQDTSVHLHRLISRLLAQGVTKTDIIKTELGFSGRRYQEANQLWSELEERHGPYEG